MGATCATETRQVAPSNVFDADEKPEFANTSDRERLLDTAKVCKSPIKREARNAPFSEPNPPTTTTTNRIGPRRAAIVACVTSAGPAITPAIAAKAAPRANTLIKTKGTLGPGCATT